MLIGIALVFLAATAASGQNINGIRLHDQAAVHDSCVYLRDVAELEGSHAKALGDTVLEDLDTDTFATTITLAQLRDTLNDHGVNWGTLSLRGYAACHVTRLAPDPEPITTAPLPTVTNPMDEIGLATPITLRQRVIELIERFAGVQQDQLRITFSDRDAPALEQSAWQDRYEFEPLASAPLGRIPIVIRRYRDNRVIETLRITADVTRRYMAAVAVGSIGRGQTFAPSDVEIREVYLDTTHNEPIIDLSSVIGQTSSTILRPGATIHPHHLRSPVLVQRGELVTVRCISGGLVIKTVGRAAEDGTRDQLIQIRSGRTRQTYAARVTGRQEVTSGSITPAPSLGEMP